MSAATNGWRSATAGGNKRTAVEFQNIPKRYPGKESQQEVNPAGFQHMGDMGRIFESELIDQDEEGGERGDEYDSFGHHVQQALHIRPVHSE